MRGPNLSAIGVKEPSVTLFLIIAILAAGLVAFLQLGRAEDPSFTIKVATVTAVWPGATAQEMQDQVADRLEKRLQELRYYDRVETQARPGMVNMTVTLKDTTPPLPSRARSTRYGKNSATRRSTCLAAWPARSSTMNIRTCISRC